MYFALFNNTNFQTFSFHMEERKKKRMIYNKAEGGSNINSIKKVGKEKKKKTLNILHLFD